MTLAELARRIDHTILKPEATDADVSRAVNEALEHRFASVCVTPAWVRLVSRGLAGSDVRTCAVVGFPHGTNKSTLKAIEATSAIKDGADEIDVVAFLPHLLARDLGATKQELSEITRAARATRRDVIIKVIVETALLMQHAPEQADDTLAIACQAVRESGCDLIKTSTGFHPTGGATVEAVRLLKNHADTLEIKASGGIRDAETALAMLEAGADRLGLSASVAVIQSLNPSP